MGNHKVLKTAGNNLRYSMYEFIDAVKQHHIIWDREHENFHNRELRDQAWQQIGQQLCKNFENGSSSEKHEIAKTLLKRWKNTRDSYLRVNRLRQSGEEISRASYIYEKELSFLLDMKTEEEDSLFKEDSLSKATGKRKQLHKLRAPIKRRCESENPSSLNDNETVPQESETKKGLLSMLDTLDYPTDTSTLPAGIATLNSKSDANTAMHNDNASGSSTISNPTTIAAASIDPDPDQAFFDSIKPHMQRMNGDQKLDFQIEVLQILRRFKPISNG